MKKKPLVKCSVKNEADWSQCKNKAVIFPVTEHGNLSRLRFCMTHWKKHKKFYDNFIEAPNGVRIGEMIDLLKRTTDDESINVQTNVHSPRILLDASSSTASSDVFYDDLSKQKNKSIKRRLIDWLKEMLR